MMISRSSGPLRFNSLLSSLPVIIFVFRSWVSDSQAKEFDSVSQSGTVNSGGSPCSVWTWTFLGNKHCSSGHGHLWLDFILLYDPLLLYFPLSYRVLPSYHPYTCSRSHLRILSFGKITFFDPHRMDLEGFGKRWRNDVASVNLFYLSVLTFLIDAGDILIRRKIWSSGVIKSRLWWILIIFVRTQV